MGSSSSNSSNGGWLPPWGGSGAAAATLAVLAPPTSARVLPAGGVLAGCLLPQIWKLMRTKSAQVRRLLPFHTCGGAVSAAVCCARSLPLCVAEAALQACCQPLHALHAPDTRIETYACTHHIIAPCLPLLPWPHARCDTSSCCHRCPPLPPSLPPHCRTSACPFWSSTGWGCSSLSSTSTGRTPLLPGFVS